MIKFKKTTKIANNTVSPKCINRHHKNYKRNATLSAVNCVQRCKGALTQQSRGKLPISQHKSLMQLLNNKQLVENVANGTMENTEMQWS